MTIECKYCGEAIRLTRDEVEAGIQLFECYICDAVFNTGLFPKEG